MFRESVFENTARGFSSSEILNSGAKSLRRSAEIMRFEIVGNVLTVDKIYIFLGLRFTTTDGLILHRLTANG